MIKNQENLSFYKPGKKTGIIYVLASMAACFFITTATMAAPTVVSTATTARVGMGPPMKELTITAAGSIAVTEPVGSAHVILIPFLGATPLENLRLFNAGTISATAPGGAMGMIANGAILKDSSIENTNTISVTTTGAQSFPGFPDSMAFYLNTLDSTTIKNSGAISVVGTRAPYGILAAKLENRSDITNTGSISIDHTAAAWTEGEANGIAVVEIIDSAVLNAGTGTISVTSPESGVGIGSNLVENGSITNSGQIRINAPNGSGIFVNTLRLGSIVKNTGSISVSPTGAGKTSYGINVLGSGSSTTITNTGSITLTTMDPSASAYGVYNGGPASFENTGTITALDSTGAMGANMYSVKTWGTVTNEGTLKGLFEAKDTTNSGLIAMPALTSTITGDYTQIGSGSLGITLFSDDTPANTKFSKLIVSGTTNLASGSGIDVDVTTASAHQELLIGQTLTGVIESAGGITADPAALRVTDNSALLKFTAALSSANTSLDLGVEKGMSIADAAVMGGCPGVAGAAGTLDTLTGSSNPQILAFISNLNTLPTEGGVARRVQQAAPVSAAQGPAMATQMANTASSIVQARQQSVRGFNSGDPLFSDRNTWVKPYASRTDQDDVDGISGFTADTFGLGIGADGEYAGDNRLGLAFFYTRAKTEANTTPQETDLDLFSLMAYGSSPIMDKTINIDYQLGGGLQPTESSRYIQALGTNATADYTAKNLFAQVKATKEFELSKNVKAMVGPRLSYLWFYTPSYQETGAGGMNLNVDSFDAQSLVAALEGDVIWSLPKDIELMVRASLGYDLINDTTFVGSSFQGGGALFSTQGLTNSPLVYGAGLGVAKKFTNRFSLDAKYDLEGRGSDLMNHMISAKLNWEF